MRRLWLVSARLRQQKYGIRACPRPTTISTRGLLSQAVQERLATMRSRHEEIMLEMSSSGRTAANLSTELSALTPAMNLLKQRDEMELEEQQLQELMEESKGEDDTEMEQECQRDLERLSQDRERLDKKILDAVLPRDENDFGSDAIIAVQAGTGGDEASLFALEIFESYEKLSRNLGFRVEILEKSKSEIGGLKEGSLLVSGGAKFALPTEDGEDDGSELMFGPYGTFKFESGVHRVQRVPINSTKIHTSACSVAVMPSINNNRNPDNMLPMSELKIETMRASGAGGQHVNTTDSACRITHIPTGITASIQDERSQHQNKEKALQLITARVRDAERAEAERARGETRSSLMGGGDRSERIRTYNYAQNRITDHRCKQSRNEIESLLGGRSEENVVTTFLPYLLILQREELLDKLEEGKR